MHKDLSLPGYTYARIYDEVSSTMDVARESMPELGLGSGVVCALKQTAGRGRQGRSWSSPSGAFMATFLHQGDAPLAAFAGYSLCVGVSLVSVFSRYNASLQLKWPNDLVVVSNGAIRKVGGILIEVQELHGKRIVLTGIGVNLSDPPVDVEHATSLKEVSGATLDAETLLPVMAQTLEENHQRFLSDGGFRAFRTQWEEASCFERGESVISIDLGFQTVSGVFDGVSDTGALQLRREGRVETFHSGHILSVERPRGGHLRRVS